MQVRPHTENAQKLLERSRVGALLRVFAATPDEVETQIDSALIALRKLLVVKTGSRKTFARIDFLVASDPDFDDSDCGETAGALRERVRAEFPDAPVHVFEIKRGDIYSMLLNYGLAIQQEDRVSYSLILSHREHEHIVPENIHALLSAMHEKARVAGLVLPELRETISKGRIANTFAMWHLKSLVTVGAFDLRAAKPMRREAESTPIIEAPSTDHAEVLGSSSATYPAAGCEEIIPLLRFVKYYGPSIRLIDPVNPEALPEPAKVFTETGMKRHLAKLATKNERQEYMADLTGLPLSSLTTGLLAQA